MRSPCRLLLITLALGSLARAQEPPGDSSVEFWEKHIRPLLAEKCVRCHGPKQQKSGLRLDSVAGLQRGGDRGPAVIAFDPDQSRLIRAVRYEDAELQMPPKARLAPEQIAVLTGWVERGAPMPAAEAEVDAAGSGAAFDLEARRRAHWVWQPLCQASVPAVPDPAWPTDPLDHWIAARLAAQGLTPSPPADRRTLARRLSFDLTGLPPSPDMVEHFVADASPQAYAQLVDRLLASPHFGERWARHWLDLVRYAETKGHEYDHRIPNAWAYRDWVIRTLNADVPYDQFVKEHIAGDLLPAPRIDPVTGGNESVIGTGFWFLGEEVHAPVDTRLDEADRLDNKLDTFSKAFLGLTVGCARCHDHKFDAISTKDYYALSGYLLSSSYRQVRYDTIEHEKRVAQQLAVLESQHRAQVCAAVAEAIAPQVERVEAMLAAATEVRAADLAVEDVAARTGVDPGRLQAWVAAIDQAVPGDVLHAFGGLPPPPLAASPASEPLLVLDYEALPRGAWLQDGVTFGLAPRRLGDLREGADAAMPIAGVLAFGAACQQPAFAGLALAPGTEREPSRIDWVQSGRTLRTPTFVLERDKLWYLVEGAGRAFVAVDSHRMVDNPLHVGVIKRFGAGGWRWIEHDLSDYRGHRVHVEFSPSDARRTDESGLAVARIMQSDGAPPLPIADLAPGATLAERARALQQTLQQALLAFANDRLMVEPQAKRLSQALAWVFRHRALFWPYGDQWDPALIEAAAPWYEARAALLATFDPRSRTAPALLDGSGVNEHVLLRGDPKAPGEIVPRRSLTALGGVTPDAAEYGSGRLALAENLLASDPPLLARVLVNRVWHHLFGRGIVPTTDNLGASGAVPLAPELLDHLAGRFMEQGWSLKRLIRTILLSSTYRRSATADPQSAKLDPHNLALHRANVRRLEAEAVRDAILATSGRLDPTMFGQPVELRLTAFVDGRGRPRENGPLDGHGRRSIYLAVRRNFLSSMFLAFDFPIPFAARGCRDVTNVPAQALTLMNDPFVAEQARVWANRVLAEPVPSDVVRIERLYSSAFSRPPTSVESQQALEFVAARRQTEPAGELEVWADLCHVLYNIKEFIYVP